MGHRFENVPARSGGGILEVKEGQALVGKLSIEFQQLFEGGSGFLLKFEVACVLGERLILIVGVIVCLVHLIFI